MLKKINWGAKVYFCRHYCKKTHRFRDKMAISPSSRRAAETGGLSSTGRQGTQGIFSDSSRSPSRAHAAGREISPSQPFFYNHYTPQTTPTPSKNSFSTQTQLSRIGETQPTDSHRGFAANSWRVIVPRIHPMCPAMPYTACPNNP